MANYLDNDIKFVAGVGEARARLLEKELGIRTLGDMLCHYPFATSTVRGSTASTRSRKGIPHSSSSGGASQASAMPERGANDVSRPS